MAVLKKSVWKSCKPFAGLLLLCLLSLALPLHVHGQTAPQNAEPSGQPAAPSAAAPKPVATASGYYIEFRVGTIGTYGHSYAVYGANGGKPNYADLHPMGGYAGMAAGHLIPVPANTAWNPDVLKLPIASRYRHALTHEQYRKLLVAVKEVKAKSPVWNAVANNCNHFIGQLAQAVGLKVPPSFQVSYSFVPALKELNAEAKGPAQKRRASPPPAS